MATSSPDFMSVVLATTYTTSDVRERLALLRRFLEDTFFAGAATPTVERLEEFLDTANAGAETRSVLARWLGAWAGALARETLYERLRSIERDVSALPVLGIIMPVRLREDEMARLGAWAREHVDPRVLVDSLADPAAVGGCRLIWNGRERDFSLSYFVEKHREELVDAVLEVFTHTTGGKT